MDSNEHSEHLGDLRAKPEETSVYQVAQALARQVLPVATAAHSAGHYHNYGTVTVQTAPLCTALAFELREGLVSSLAEYWHTQGNGPLVLEAAGEMLPGRFILIENNPADLQRPEFELYLGWK